MDNNNNNMTKTKVLDHGHIAIIDKMGNDQSVAEAARISYGETSKSSARDRHLIRYLMRHKHTSPFEMCEIKLLVKAPLFVARQWLRHRTANVNEYSGRYSVMCDDCYIPETTQITTQSTSNHQGRSSQECHDVSRIRSEMIDHCTRSLELYKSFLDAGMAREVARIILPCNIYTEFVWKIDLHNLLHFIKLRIEPGSQYEIRCYADVCMSIVKEWVPSVYEAFMDYQMDGCLLSGPERMVISTMSVEDKGKYDTMLNKLSKRERDEFKEKMEK